MIRSRPSPMETARYHPYDPHCDTCAREERLRQEMLATTNALPSAPAPEPVPVSSLLRPTPTKTPSPTPTKEPSPAPTKGPTPIPSPTPTQTKAPSTTPTKVPTSAPTPTAAKAPHKTSAPKKLLPSKEESAPPLFVPWSCIGAYRWTPEEIYLAIEAGIAVYKGKVTFSDGKKCRYPRNDEHPEEELERAFQHQLEQRKLMPGKKGGRPGKGVMRKLNEVEKVVEYEQGKRTSLPSGVSEPAKIAGWRWKERVMDLVEAKKEWKSEKGDDGLSDAQIQDTLRRIGTSDPNFIAWAILLEGKRKKKPSEEQEDFMSYFGF